MNNPKKKKKKKIGENKSIINQNSNNFKQDKISSKQQKVKEIDIQLEHKTVLKFKNTIFEKFFFIECLY